MVLIFNWNVLKSIAKGLIFTEDKVKKFCHINVSKIIVLLFKSINY